MNNILMYAENILNSIIKIFEEYDVIVSGRVEYSGRAVLVEDEYGTRIWIRLSDYRNINKVRVEFSTVEIRDDIRRKGVFSKICNMIKEKDYVEHAVISNVCTPEMSKFCKKNKLEFNEMMNEYRIV